MRGTEVTTPRQAPQTEAPPLVIVAPSRKQVFARRGLAVLKELCWYLVILTVCAVILLPVGWMLTAALKPDLAAIYTFTPQWFPTHYWHWNNFYRAMVYPLFPFLRYTINTLFVVFANILGILISFPLIAYPFATMMFRFRDPLFYVLIITILMT